MKKNKEVVICVVILLVAIIASSSYYLLSNLGKRAEENQEFEELQDEIIVPVETEEVEESEEVGTTASSSSSYKIDLSELYRKNNDLVAWIKINGTNINYPVMQNGECYLHRNFYKNYSYSGTPFLSSSCNIKASSNLVIYGHHMKNGTMFSNLGNYTSYSYYSNHKNILLYTLSNDKQETYKRNYEIIAVIKVVANSKESYEFYGTTNFYDKEDFDEYYNLVKASSLYDTGVIASYGDRFITLSTCEYSQKNGRIIVVGREK